MDKYYKEFDLLERIIIYGVFNRKLQEITLNDISIQFSEDILIIKRKTKEYELKGNKGKYVWQLLKFFGYLK